MSLLKMSNEWKEKADILLKEKGLFDDLSQYGEVHFTGAYAYNLMMHGDVDISVVRDEAFSNKEVFEIFKSLYFKANFRSYFIAGDWDDPRKGNEFPEGFYIGLKEKINGERWKFDIWFLDKDAFHKRNNNPKLSSASEKEKELILECKQVRKKRKLDTTGQEIYDLVLSGKVKSIEDFSKIFN